jgi:hypothetical protein
MPLLSYRSSCFSAEGLSSSKMWRFSQNKRKTGITFLCTVMETIVRSSFAKLKVSGVILEGVYLSGAQWPKPCSSNMKSVAWSKCVKRDRFVHPYQRSYKACFGRKRPHTRETSYTEEMDIVQIGKQRYHTTGLGTEVTREHSSRYSRKSNWGNTNKIVLDKRTTPLAEVQELYNFKKF